MSNIITVRLGDSRRITAPALYQHDYGQILKPEAPGLPESYEVHFSAGSSGEAWRVIGGAEGAAIPDALLTLGQTLHAYLFLHTGEDDGETIYDITIPVRPRAQAVSAPDITPEERDIIVKAIEALNNAIAKTDANVAHYPRIVNDVWEVWDADAGEFISTSIPATGPQGIVGPQSPKGDTGEQGPKGEKGDKGDDGITEMPLYSVASVGTDWDQGSWEIRQGETRTTETFEEYQLARGDYYFFLLEYDYNYGVYKTLRFVLQCYEEVRNGNAILVFGDTSDCYFDDRDPVQFPFTMALWPTSQEHLYNVGIKIAESYKNTMGELYVKWQRIGTTIDNPNLPLEQAVNALVSLMRDPYADAAMFRMDRTMPTNP